MAVSSSVGLESGIYVPFFQDVRGGKEGRSPVGTLAQTLREVGDGSGGTVVAGFSMQRITFGFRAIIAPTLLASSDNLATPEAVRLQFAASGNRRLGTSIDQAVVALAAPDKNVAQFDVSGLVLESDLLSETVVINFIWSTNTNLKEYDINIFASVFDAEIIEAQGSISDFLAGVR